MGFAKSLGNEHTESMTILSILTIQQELKDVYCVARLPSNNTEDQFGKEQKSHALGFKGSP